MRVLQKNLRIFTNSTFLIYTLKDNHGFMTNVDVNFFFELLPKEEILFVFLLLQLNMLR